MKDYHEKIDQLEQFYCTNCHELWPSTIKFCSQCRKDKLTFSTVEILLTNSPNKPHINFLLILKENNMIPGFDEIPERIKKILEELTMIEEMLISPILAIMSVYRLQGGALINRGFVANFTQDISHF